MLFTLMLLNEWTEVSHVPTRVCATFVFPSLFTCLFPIKFDVGDCSSVDNMSSALVSVH